MAIVIIPAFKPDEALIEVTEKVHSMGYKIIVVDDGSGIEYQKYFQAVAGSATVLHHSENCGKGAAIKTALAYINDKMPGNNVIGVMDSDGQHCAKDMQRVLAAADRYPEAMVLGVRNVGREMPLKSRMGNRITRAIFQMTTGVKVSDTQTGLRAFNSALIDRLLLIKGERYEYETNVLIELARAEVPIEEVPIDTIYHDKTNSCSHFHVVRDSLRIYKDLLKFTLSSFSSFVVDYILFALMMLILPHTAGFLLLANVSARVFSALYNYSINCHLVFNVRCRIKTAAEYFALAVFILVMNSLILGMLVQLLNFSVYPAKILTEIILFCISWAVQRFIIFNKKTRTDSKKICKRAAVPCPIGKKEGI